MRTASSVSVSVPIWFSLTRSALPTPSAIPRARISGFVTKTSSPTSRIFAPSSFVMACQPFQSCSARPSSIDRIGYAATSSAQYRIMPSVESVFFSPFRRYLPPS